MNEYAFVVSCNKAYQFGMMATMNAQMAAGTRADWEIAYEGFDEEERSAINSAFPFDINWTPVNELMKEIVDNRTKKEPFNRFWLAYWLLARKVLREKKYKAVCVIQADTFILINLNPYFKMCSRAGLFITSEYPFSGLNAEELPFGDDKAIWDRHQCAIFDSTNFLNQDHIGIADDTIRFQCEDAFKGEADHSVIALNRAVVKNCSKDEVLRLERHTWVFDSSWGNVPLRRNGNKVLNNLGIQINAWHGRWWHKGRGIAELKSREGDPSQAILSGNIELANEIMEMYNNLKPTAKGEFISA